MALGHLLYCNNDGLDLVSALGLDLERWADEAQKVAKLSNVLGDIKLLLSVA